MKFNLNSKLENFIKTCSFLKEKTIFLNFFLKNHLVTLMDFLYFFPKRYFFLQPLNFFLKEIPVFKEEKKNLKEYLFDSKNNTILIENKIIVAVKILQKFFINQNLIIKTRLLFLNSSLNSKYKYLNIIFKHVFKGRKYYYNRLFIKNNSLILFLNNFSFNVNNDSLITFFPTIIFNKAILSEEFFYQNYYKIFYCKYHLSFISIYDMTQKLMKKNFNILCSTLILKILNTIKIEEFFFLKLQRENNFNKKKILFFNQRKKSFINLHLPKTKKELLNAYSFFNLEFDHFFFNFLKLKKKERCSLISLKEFDFFQLNLKFQKSILLFEKITKIVLSSEQLLAVQKFILLIKKNKNLELLILGEVASGKTFLALLLSFLFSLFLVKPFIVFISPTRVLNRLQFLKYSSVLIKLNFKVQLILNSKDYFNISVLKDKKQFLFVTHSIFFSLKYFKEKIGLVILDEEQKFGLKDTFFLKELTKNVSYFLMTATPLPLTLAKSYLGLIDTLYLTKSFYKRNITTILENNLEIVFKKILFNFKNSIKTLIIVSRILSTITKKNLSIVDLQDFFKKNNIDNKDFLVLHSKLSKLEFIIRIPKLKTSKIILSTSILEVGLDLPDISQVIIFNAENFGLSVLHQIRGRIGRDGRKSECLLFYSTENLTSISKLKKFSLIQDGNKIAFLDLKNRDFGSILGKNLKQSGLSIKNKFINRIISNFLFFKNKFTEIEKKYLKIEIPEEKIDNFFEKFLK